MVLGNDQRRETDVCIDTWVRVVEHDVDSRLGSTRSRPGKKTSRFRKGKQCCFIARAPIGETVYPTVPNALTNRNGRGVKLAD